MRMTGMDKSGFRGGRELGREREYRGEGKHGGREGVREDLLEDGEDHEGGKNWRGQSIRGVVTGVARAMGKSGGGREGGWSDDGWREGGRGK